MADRTTLAAVASHSLHPHFDSPLLAFVNTPFPLQVSTLINVRFLTRAQHHFPRLVMEHMNDPRELFKTLPSLLVPFPVQVSLTLLAFSRVVSASSEACFWLVRSSAVDVVVESVCRSRFLEDYEHGCVIICALLRASVEKARRRRVVEFDFSPVVDKTPIQQM
ncbi:hypothetical protein BLNAU_6182 [Blattamonas nauphoetae]|uniref:Uncharacterized protein n=1 Tax=Blattamonas nauphoetae TaxID=2049346 RepID=A0ABQ9Y5A5_9EUKA|nr:hypothetical protein BLNAU_6182 [Blattamonas nauphoetae]